MIYSTHFHNDFFGHLFPHADEIECIYNGFLLWDCKVGFYK